MRVRRSQRMLVLAISATVVSILQVIALIRYVQRLPGEWVGIALYSGVACALAAAAVRSYVGWARTRGQRTVLSGPED